MCMCGNEDNEPGTEYWTLDKKGRGYCSTLSLEDAVINHIREMHHGNWVDTEPHGPIVDIKIIHREIKRETVLLSENKKPVTRIESLLESE